MSLPILIQEFSIPAIDFKRLLTKNKYALSLEKTREGLMGIHFNIEEDFYGDKIKQSLVAVASDGEIMSYMAIPAPIEARGMQGFTIPRNTILSLLSDLKKPKGNILIKLFVNNLESKDISYVHFALQDMEALTTSDCIMEKYPNYQNIIPRNNNTIKLTRLELLDILLKIKSNTKNRFKTAYFHIKNNSLLVSDYEWTNHIDPITRKEALDKLTKMEFSVDYIGEPQKFHCNIKHIIAILKNIECKTVCIDFADYRTPWGIYIDKGEFGEFAKLDTAKELYVLMGHHC